MSKECYTRYEVERQLWARWPRVLVVTEHSPQGTAQRRYVPEDSVEVVRCRDCRHFKKLYSGSFCAKSITTLSDPDGFCAWGEKKVVS